QYDERIYGTAAWGLRRQGRRLSARRREPAQLHERPWAGRRDLGARGPSRTQTAKDRRHDGLHVRKPLRHAAHALCNRVVGAATRLFRGLAGSGKAFPQTFVVNLTHPSSCHIKSWFAASDRRTSLPTNKDPAMLPFKKFLPTIVAAMLIGAAAARAENYPTRPITA